MAQVGKKRAAGDSCRSSVSGREGLEWLAVGIVRNLVRTSGTAEDGDGGTNGREAGSVPRREETSTPREDSFCFGTARHDEWVDSFYYQKKKSNPLRGSEYSKISTNNIAIGLVRVHKIRFQPTQNMLSSGPTKLPTLPSTSDIPFQFFLLRSSRAPS
jgi:hypothetical protein